MEGSSGWRMLASDFVMSLMWVWSSVLIKVLGSITGVRLILDTFPDIGRGPELNVDIHRGALTEGCLTFMIVFISLGLSRQIPGSSFMKTWISSLSKVTLHVLGSDLTGGCMNPASLKWQMNSLCGEEFRENRSSIPTSTIPLGPVPGANASGPGSTSFLKDGPVG
nr:probable aquaporin SIP2-1 [Ipomoea batatas]